MSNWGRWGAEDQMGAWNLVTPQKVIEAAECVRKGAVFSLALPFGAGGPSEGGCPGRPNAQLFVSTSGTDIAAGAVDTLYPGSGKFTNDWVMMNLSTCTSSNLADMGRGRRAPIVCRPKPTSLPSTRSGMTLPP